MLKIVGGGALGIAREETPQGALNRWMDRGTRRTVRRVNAFAGALAKRSMDITLTLLIAPVVLPLLALAAIAIKLTDGGPVLFWQERVGKGGVTFPFPKLRSMVVNAEALRAKLEAANDHREGVTFKMRRDPRVTWIGRIIRKFSIDELPQLWCVLTGEMTLVGPRPALPAEVARYTASDRRRLAVTPGLTCIWQVLGRAQIPFAEQVELDVQYIRDRGFWLDLELLVRTIPAVLTGRGAY